MEDLNVVDSINHAGTWLARNQELLLSYAVNIVAAIAILIVGMIVARVVSNTVNRLMLARKIDATVADFLSALVRYAVIAFTLIASLGRVGVQTSSVIAVLGAAGVSGRESNVLHAAAGRIPREVIAGTRDYDEAAWHHHEQALAERGLLDGDGALTDAGRDLKGRVEAATDTLSLSALEALDDDEVEALFRALTPITRAVVAAGDVPAVTPMGLQRDDLHDGSAHLVS